MKKTLGYFFNYFSGVACLVICILFGMEMVFQLSVENNVVVSTVHSGLFFYFLLDLFIRIGIQQNPRYLLSHPTDFCAAYPALVYFFPKFASIGVSQIFISQIFLLLIVIGRFHHVTFFFHFLRLSPSQLLILSSNFFC